MHARWVLLDAQLCENETRTTHKKKIKICVGQTSTSNYLDEQHKGVLLAPSHLSVPEYVTLHCSNHIGKQKLTACHPHGSL